MTINGQQVARNNILFFDTETTGLGKDARICQIAWLVCSPTGEILTANMAYIKPDNWTIDPQAEAVHGISLDDCESHGRPVSMVLHEFGRAMDDCATVVAYNLPFDARMIAQEYTAMGNPDASPLLRNAPDVDFVCAMQMASGVMKLPATEKMQAVGRSEYKAPKLAEAYQYFTRCELVDAHDAMADVTATATIYTRMIASGVTPAICDITHSNKGKPKKDPLPVVEIAPDTAATLDELIKQWEAVKGNIKILELEEEELKASILALTTTNGSYKLPTGRTVEITTVKKEAHTKTVTYKASEYQKISVKGEIA